MVFGAAGAMQWRLLYLRWVNGEIASWTGLLVWWTVKRVRRLHRPRDRVATRRCWLVSIEKLPHNEVVLSASRQRNRRAQSTSAQTSICNGSEYAPRCFNSQLDLECRTGLNVQSKLCPQCLRSASSMHVASNCSMCNDSSNSQAWIINPRLSA